MRPSRICGFSGRQRAISELRSRCNEKDGSRGAVLIGRSITLRFWPYIQ